MGTPYDGDGGDGYGGIFPAEEAFSKLPGEWQADSWVQHMYAELMTSESWAEAKGWHDDIQLYIYDQYDANFDDYFLWDDWRDSYDAHVG